MQWDTCIGAAWSTSLLIRAEQMDNHSFQVQGLGGSLAVVLRWKC
jgi:hypothetical protein